jgi:ABC-type methionine transport system ATPase subunit
MPKIIQLIYPADLVSQPVVSHLISEFHLDVNILRAEIAREEGSMILEVSGDAGRMEEAFAWLKEQGLELKDNPPLDSQSLGGRREFFS